jgi:hypothetical protein
MIKSLVFYATKGLLPRLRRIVINLGFALSIVIGVTCFSQGPNLPVAQLKSSDVGSMILTYAAIAFGFCITGMALVLTLPNDRFLKSLQCHKIDSKSQSSYLDLLFVFSWTAVCHWLLVVSGIAIIIFRGTVPNLMSQSDALGWRLFVSWFFGLCAYSLIQFLMTVITLSQLGHLYSKDLDNDMPSSKQ